MHAVCVALGVRCARSSPPLVLIGRAPMLNDTTKPGEVPHKGGLDLLTLLHRRDVELHAHLTLWCNDDQQRCEHFDHGFIVTATCFEADRMTSRVSAAETDCDFRE